MRRPKWFVTVAMVLALTLGGCTATTVLNDLSVLGIQITPDNVISAVQGVITAIQWIEPIAGGVLAVFFPATIPVYNLACNAANAAIVVAQDAIAAYKADPSNANYQILVTNLTDLQDFWKALEQAFQGKTTAPAALAAVAAKATK